MFTESRAQEIVNSKVIAFWSIKTTTQQKLFLKRYAFEQHGVASSLCQITLSYPDNVRVFIQLLKGQKLWQNLKIAMTLNFHYREHHFTKNSDCKTFIIAHTKKTNMKSVSSAQVLFFSFMSIFLTSMFCHPFPSFLSLGWGCAGVFPG